MDSQHCSVVQWYVRASVKETRPRPVLAHTVQIRNLYAMIPKQLARCHGRFNKLSADGAGHDHQPEPAGAERG
jgi:hypothetical protein